MLSNHLYYFSSYFSFRLDKQKTGLVSLIVIFKSFEWERCIFTDCLLELIEIEHGNLAITITIR